MRLKPPQLLLVAVLLLPLKVFALAGQLTSPSLAFPADFPAASRSNILVALKHDDYKFVGGEFVNASTQLRYGGDTKALNLFFNQLSKCSDVVLAITFVPRIEGHPEATWAVSHTAWGDSSRLNIQISFTAKEIHLEELVIPSIKCGS